MSVGSSVACRASAVFLNVEIFSHQLGRACAFAIESNAAGERRLDVVRVELNLLISDLRLALDRQGLDMAALRDRALAEKDDEASAKDETIEGLKGGVDLLSNQLKSLEGEISGVRGEKDEAVKELHKILEQRREVKDRAEELERLRGAKEEEVKAHSETKSAAAAVVSLLEGENAELRAANDGLLLELAKRKEVRMLRGPSRPRRRLNARYFRFPVRPFSAGF